MTTKTRAAKGGEYGINGEFYNGGEFLPSSPKTIKGEMKTRKTAKKQASQNKVELQEKIDNFMAESYPNKTTWQARELYTAYLKENGVNTQWMNIYSTDLINWIG